MAEKDLTLTNEERDFAEVNHDMVRRYLRENGQQFEDWYDIVIFGYLKAVRCWFRTPEVRRWKFYTIAKVKMRAAVIAHFRYQCRQKRTGNVISLDAPFTEDEEATLHGLIASDVDTEESAIFEMLVLSMGSGLSTLEKTVLRLQSEGYCQAEIGQELGLSIRAVAQALSSARDHCRKNRQSEAV